MPLLGQLGFGPRLPEPAYESTASRLLRESGASPVQFVLPPGYAAPATPLPGLGAPARPEVTEALASIRGLSSEALKSSESEWDKVGEDISAHALKITGAGSANQNAPSMSAGPQVQAAVPERKTDIFWAGGNSGVPTPMPPALSSREDAAWRWFGREAMDFPGGPTLRENQILQDMRLERSMASYRDAGVAFPSYEEGIHLQRMRLGLENMKPPSEKRAWGPEDEASLRSLSERIDENTGRISHPKPLDRFAGQVASAALPFDMAGSYAPPPGGTFGEKVLDLAGGTVGAVAKYSVGGKVADAALSKVPAVGAALSAVAGKGGSKSREIMANTAASYVRNLATFELTDQVSLPINATADERLATDRLAIGTAGKFTAAGALGVVPIVGKGMQYAALAKIGADGVGEGASLEDQMLGAATMVALKAHGEGKSKKAAIKLTEKAIKMQRDASPKTMVGGYDSVPRGRAVGDPLSEWAIGEPIGLGKNTPLPESLRKLYGGGNYRAVTEDPMIDFIKTGKVTNRNGDHSNWAPNPLVWFALKSKSGNHGFVFETGRDKANLPGSSGQDRFVKKGTVSREDITRVWEVSRAAGKRPMSVVRMRELDPSSLRISGSPKDGLTDAQIRAIAKQAVESKPLKDLALAVAEAKDIVPRAINNMVATDIIDGNSAAQAILNTPIKQHIKNFLKDAGVEKTIDGYDMKREPSLAAKVFAKALGTRVVTRLDLSSLRGPNESDEAFRASLGRPIPEKFIRRTGEMTYAMTEDAPSRAEMIANVLHQGPYGDNVYLLGDYFGVATKEGFRYWDQWDFAKNADDVRSAGSPMSRKMLSKFIRPTIITDVIPWSDVVKSAYKLNPPAPWDPDPYAAETRATEAMAKMGVFQTGPETWEYLGK